MQPTECGVVSLAIIMASLGKWVPIAQIRETVGLDGNGLSIAGVARAGKHYGLEPHIFRCGPDSLATKKMPVIAWWERRHFVVIEGRGHGGWHVNDPEGGHRLVPDEEFNSKFSGMIIEFRTTADFKRSGHPPRIFPSLARMLSGANGAFIACAVASIAVIPLHLAMAGFLTYFVDRVLEHPLNEILRPFLVAVAVVVILRTILSFILAQTQLRLVTAAGLRIEVSLLEKAISLSDRELTLRLPGDIQQRIQLGKNIASSAVGSLAMLPSQFLSAVVFGGAVFLISPIVGFGVVGASILGVGIVKGVTRLLFELNTKVQIALASQRSTMFAGLSSQSWLFESGNVGGFLERWTSELASARSLSQRSARALLFASSGRGLLAKLVSQVATLVFGGLGVISGSVTIGELAALQLLVGHAEGAIGGLIGFGQSVPVLKSNISRLDDIMSCPDSDTEDHLPVSNEGEAGLEFKDIPVKGEGRISGRAASRGVTVVRGCTQRSAVDLAKRLAGRIKGGGSLTWHSKSKDDSSSPNVRVCLGHCPLFPGSYEENLSNFDPHISTSEVWKVLDAVKLASKFKSLPLGLGAQVQEGDGLSSGETGVRLEIATLLVKPCDLVIIAGGMAWLPLEDSLQFLRLLSEQGTAVIVVEPGAPQPDDATIIEIEPLPEADR